MFGLHSLGGGLRRQIVGRDGPLCAVAQQQHTEKLLTAGKRLGRRRGWILIAQIVIGCGLLAMALLGPKHGLLALGMAALAVAFASATQDIVVDAWRIEAADTHRGARPPLQRLSARLPDRRHHQRRPDPLRRQSSGMADLLCPDGPADDAGHHRDAQGDGAGGRGRGPAREIGRGAAVDGPGACSTRWSDRSSPSSRPGGGWAS